MTGYPSAQLVVQAAQLAANWQRKANGRLSAAEKKAQKKLKRLIKSPAGKVVFANLIDQCFRSADNRRIADQFHHQLMLHGLPEFFTPFEKFLLLIFLTLGRRLPALAVPRITAKIRHDAGRMVVAGESSDVAKHLTKAKQSGLQININHLGEAVLGEQEAQRRLAAYLRDLENPLIEYLSVKISTIFSQIQPLAFDHCADLLSQRLATLYRKAMPSTHSGQSGRSRAKMVNLDMEAYDDLALTVTAFRKALDLPDLSSYCAGMVLQAYLPESFALQRELTRWARDRVAKGGAPIKIRIVKGANMEMEQITAAINGWPLAPFNDKSEADANYKRMILYGTRPENINAVQLGIASHNLFELAFALLAAREMHTESGLTFELLEGMANQVRRVLIEEGLPVLAYTPVAKKHEFINAIAYLIRRLDENTGPENFIGHAALIDPDSIQWLELRHAFLTSVKKIAHLPDGSHRNQNRLGKFADRKKSDPDGDEFHNEPDTDWSIVANRQWAADIRRKWRRSADLPPKAIPLVIAGRAKDRFEEVAAGNIPGGDSPGGELVEIFDPNQFPRRICVARCRLACREDIQAAVAAGRADPDGWRLRSHMQRREILNRVADEIAAARADLIGSAAAGTGKLFAEADIEVSEAVDLTRYYPLSMIRLSHETRLDFHGKGLGVVASPWNFPIAIACGGIAAALAGGNTVIFKPSSEALLPAWELCKCFWAAGISQNTLQFVPCRGGRMGRHLIGHPAVDFVILTGGTATALEMLTLRPDLFIAAETGGKNATIVTAMADRDQAIKNVIRSAFGHSGQKCSATSLLILEKEVYDDPHFQDVLVDAAGSLSVGSAWEFHHRMGPLIHPPAGVLARAVSRLEPGEIWALEPRPKGENPNLWSPGIKYGVQPGSFTHMTELFGPVLGVMRADDLRHAVALANRTGYGLTAGIESLDERETTLWRDTIRAGNLYINRHTTGAVTLRQPFGGMNQSAVGPGIKTGGPNYVTQFIKAVESRPPAVDIIREEHWLLSLAQSWRRKHRWGQWGCSETQMDKSILAIQSYLAWAQKEFLQTHDFFHLRGEDNQHRYLPIGRVGVCLHPDDSLFEAIARVAAGIICGNRVRLLVPKDLDNDVTAFIKSREGQRLLRHGRVTYQAPSVTPATLQEMHRLRYAAPHRVPPAIYEAAAPIGRYIAASPVLMEGRLELLHYVTNQSISNAYHRYGNLGERALTRGGQ